METKIEKLNLAWPYLDREHRLTRESGHVDVIAIACAERDASKKLIDRQTQRMMDIPYDDRLRIANLLSLWHWRGEQFPDWQSPIKYDPVTSDHRMTEADMFRQCARAAVRVVLRDDIRGTFTRTHIEELRQLVLKHNLLEFLSLPSPETSWWTTDDARSLVGEYEQA